MVTLISRRGRNVYLEALGSQDLEAHVAMRASTIFGMRSMTKEITATALMCLVEAGSLHLDDPISKYLPEFASLKVAPAGQPLCAPSRPVTILDLLTETSGMAADRPQPIANITRVLDRPLAEVVSKKSYEQFVADRIFQPLGMHDSFFFPPAKKWSRIAAMYNLETAPLHRDIIDIYRKGAKYSAPEFGMFYCARYRTLPPHDDERRHSRWTPYLQT
jgi:CubicO group peptidase (beta-lactamase class C family)